ncbi:hypothetical protein SUGI_0963440 [Cryptomeria japonica]|nr:hypothetical protein SUGI_0963440 [Cryptomeria japonica]
MASEGGEFGRGSGSSRFLTGEHVVVAPIQGKGGQGKIRSWSDEADEAFPIEAMRNQIVGKGNFKKWCRSQWGEDINFNVLLNDYYPIEFMKKEDIRNAKNKGPYTLDGIGVHIIDWKPNFNPRFHTLLESTVWLRLYNYPSDYWHIEIIKDICKELGTFVSGDDILEDRVWGIFIRICINTNQISRILEELKIIGASKVWIQRIDREDQLHRCPKCFSREHIGLECEVSASILRIYACVQTKSTDVKSHKENIEKLGTNDVEQCSTASMKEVEINNLVDNSPLIVSSQQQIHTNKSDSAQALLNLLEDVKSLQNEITTELAASLSSESTKASEFRVTEDENIPPLPVDPNASSDLGKKRITTNLEEGEIVSSASEWEEDFEPVANLIMDNTAKGFGKTASYINVPNFRPKGKRGHKSRKSMLKITGVASGQSKLNLGKGTPLPQDQ